jgi:hypothetical protein
VLTHLVLFIPIRSAWKAVFVVLPFLFAALDEGAGWLVRFADPGFAPLKVAGFLLLQASLAALVALAIWSVLRGTDANYRSSELE